MSSTLHPEYPYSSHYLKIGGHRIHYIDEGEGPVTVLLHGNPTWSFYYRNLIRDLKKKGRVLAFDHLGCGLSDKPADYEYTLQNHISNLEKCIEQLDLSSFSLVMHDWGGAIGFGYIRKYPQKIEKIIVHNTAAFRSLRIPLRIAVCKIPFLGALLVRGMNGFARAATFMAVTKKMSPETKRGYLLPYDSWHNRIAVHQFVRDIPLNSSHRSYATLADVEKGIDEVIQRKIPILVLWGGKDFCFNTHFYEQWLQRIPTCSSRYFKEYGHYLLEDGGDEVLACCTEFL